MPIKLVINKARVPVKIWTDQVESAALDQLTNVANLPFVFKHVAVMPDVHVGKGATIGSVIATIRAVIPNAVGVDIGCGVGAVLLGGVTMEEIEPLRETLRNQIIRSIPTGRNKHTKISSEAKDWKGWDIFRDSVPKDIWKKEEADALGKLGTCGGGNHFLEISRDTEGGIWAVLHSGSRHVGKTIAEYHAKVAKDLMMLMHVALPTHDLSYLPEGTPEYDSYMKGLRWAQAYAMENRRWMMNRIVDQVQRLLDRPVPRAEEINCHHNFAEMENHFGMNVLITRKGAIRAREGEMGIIPGSMGDLSYIVKGLGNLDSFQSSPHGAGRTMSRTAARKTLSMEKFAKDMEGVTCTLSPALLDEAPDAYKKIAEVMDNSSDLVQPVYTLKQFISIKDED